MELTKKIIKIPIFVYTSVLGNTKYRLDNHCKALNSHKTCYLLDGCQ